MATDTAEPAAPEEIQAIPVRHPGRWVAVAILVFVGIALGNSVASNSRFQWGIIRHYLFDDRILRGVVVTIELTIAAMAIGIALGVLLAVMRLSPNPIVASVSWVYIWIFR